MLPFSNKPNLVDLKSGLKNGKIPENLITRCQLRNKKLLIQKEPTLKMENYIKPAKQKKKKKARNYKIKNLLRNHYGYLT